jgi:hypothetical protein
VASDKLFFLDPQENENAKQGRGRISLVGAQRREFPDSEKAILYTNIMPLKREQVTLSCEVPRRMEFSVSNRKQNFKDAECKIITQKKTQTENFLEESQGKVVPRWELLCSYVSNGAYGLVSVTSYGEC